MKKKIIILFLLFFNIVNSQKITENYEIINTTESGNIKKGLKKYSRSERYNLDFAKSITTTLSKDFFSNVERINYSYNTATFKKTDTIHYVVYDFFLKKELDISKLSKYINIGIKRISLYEAPVICTTFFNQEKITCVCRNSFEPDYIKDEEFINAIKENTEKRLKSTKAK